LAVILLTSNLSHEDKRRLESLKVETSLMKPVKQAELLDAISMALGIVEAPEEDSPPKVIDPLLQLPPLRILLAEDSVVNQKLAVGLLEKHGHRVTVANHGKEAIAQLAAASFDVVLMDVEMPEMDGIEATAVIRAREKKTGTHIPIIAMTAHALQGDQLRCLEAGMDAYVPKPVRTRVLLGTLAAVLSKPTSVEAQADTGLHGTE
jgi:CheY-like chemotaxis protein